MKNKKAWVRLVEVFVAISLITGVLLIVVDKEYIEKEDSSIKVYEDEISILREIELNNTLRSDILNANPLPVEWENFTAQNLEDVKNKIITRTPDYLDCEAKICEMNVVCILDKDIDKDVYAQSVVISANLEVYNPRQLKLFCWPK